MILQAAGKPGLFYCATMPTMDEHQFILEDELAAAWYEFYSAHIDFEGMRPGTPLYKERWEALIEALGAYDSVLQKMKQQDNTVAGG